ncbi:hypothetical protein DPMN_088179 [Dreissena polymorpha]|uniref:Uncharacterized protein n=1 Tax=Dreissena polymorpha TaxID=45954 RepID=A0A9D4KUD1_DREPO|nr:hypothetical protein DPMN_088179 [Dreissena polymorpha]
MADGKMTGPAAGHFLTSTLVGLHHNGQHEGTQANMISLCLQVYELLVRIMSNIHSHMLTI